MLGSGQESASGCTEAAAICGLPWFLAASSRVGSGHLACLECFHVVLLLSTRNGEYRSRPHSLTARTCSAPCVVFVGARNSALNKARGEACRLFGTVGSIMSHGSESASRPTEPRGVVLSLMLSPWTDKTRVFGGPRLRSWCHTKTTWWMAAKTRANEAAACYTSRLSAV